MPLNEGTPTAKHNLNVSNCTFNIAVWVERECFFEQKQRNIIYQLPFVLSKGCKFVLHHHLWLFHSSVVQNKLACSDHRLWKHVHSDLLQVPIWVDERLQLKIVASREPSFWFSSRICFQLPSGSCSLSNLAVNSLLRKRVDCLSVLEAIFKFISLFNR